MLLMGGVHVNVGAGQVVITCTCTLYVANIGMGGVLVHCNYMYTVC